MNNPEEHTLGGRVSRGYIIFSDMRRKQQTARKPNLTVTLAFDVHATRWQPGPGRHTETLARPGRDLAALCQPFPLHRSPGGRPGRPPAGRRRR